MSEAPLRTFGNCAVGSHLAVFSWVPWVGWTVTEAIMAARTVDSEPALSEQVHAGL